MSDVCHYCGATYHPMPVYVLVRPLGLKFGDKPAMRITVCHHEFKYDDKGEFLAIEEKEECHIKALEEGYEFRRDLTPSR